MTNRRSGDFQGLISVTKALADESRVRIYLLFGEEPLCPCHVVAVLGLAQSTVSKHLSILRQAGLIESRKEGRWVHYRAAAGGSTVVKEAARWVRRTTDGDERVRNDAARLRQIKRIPRDRLCRMQRGGRST